MEEEGRLLRSFRGFVPTPNHIQTHIDSLPQLHPLLTGEQVWECLPEEVRNAVKPSHIQSFVRQMSEQIKKGNFSGSELLQMDEHCVKSNNGSITLVTGRLHNILAGCEDD